MAIVKHGHVIPRCMLSLRLVFKQIMVCAFTFQAAQEAFNKRIIQKLA